MAQKNLHFFDFIYARNFSKFQQSKDIMKTGKSTSAIRFRVLPPFFREAKKCHAVTSAKADKIFSHNLGLTRQHLKKDTLRSPTLAGRSRAFQISIA
jgi:hypothetical protein